MCVLLWRINPLNRLNVLINDEKNLLIIDFALGDLFNIEVIILTKICLRKNRKLQFTVLFFLIHEKVDIQGIVEVGMETAI